MCRGSCRPGKPRDRHWADRRTLRAPCPSGAGVRKGSDRGIIRIGSCAVAPGYMLEIVHHVRKESPAFRAGGVCPVHPLNPPVTRSICSGVSSSFSVFLSMMNPLSVFSCMDRAFHWLIRRRRPRGQFREQFHYTRKQIWGNRMDELQDEVSFLIDDIPHDPALQDAVSVAEVR